MERRYNVHIKPRDSIADSTVPETVVPRTFSQVPVILESRSRHLSVNLMLLTKPLSLDSYMASRYLFPSRRSSLRVRRWLTLENAPSTITSHTSPALSLWELKYFSSTRRSSDLLSSVNQEVHAR